MGYRRLAVIGAALLTVASNASAQLNAPVAANAYITQSGLDWAWANPLPGSAGDLAYQSGFGWRFPTAAELLAAPLATDFLFIGANVPFNGVDPISGASFQATNAAYTGDGACAAGYFGGSYTHCDWVDGNGQSYVWAGSDGAPSWADQLYVRTALNGAVPEPGTWAMMLLGFGAVGGAMRRKRRGSALLATA